MLLLSIHPEYVEKILNGTKTVELRKRKPKVALGSKVLIYSTLPEGKIVGTASISKIDVYSPEYLWRLIGKDCGVVKSKYDAYFFNSNQAVGVHLGQVKPLSIPLTLTWLRQIWPGFQPPQQFRYLDEADVETLLGRSPTLLAS